jgi:hypothetical protein
MGLREDLQKKIERKKQEISDLEGQIKEAKSYVQALEDTLKMLPREGANDGSAAAFLRPHSALAKARDAIRKAGRPLHITELLQAVGKPVNRTNRSGLSGSIGAYYRRGEIFTRPAPNTYGLVELGQAGEMPSEPPPNFGKDED